MEKIPSFTIDHLRLLRGIYVSRKDYLGDQVVTTFDIRMKEPNREPVLVLAIALRSAVATCIAVVKKSPNVLAMLYIAV